MSGVNWRQSGSIIDKREPSRVAMGQDVDRLPVLHSGNLLDQIQAVLPNHPAMFFIFFGDLSRCAQSEINLFLGRSPPVRLGLPVRSASRTDSSRGELGLSFGDAAQLSL